MWPPSPWKPTLNREHPLHDRHLLGSLSVLSTENRKHPFCDQPSPRKPHLNREHSLHDKPSTTDPYHDHLLIREYPLRGSPCISQISHWLILVAFGYSWTSTISQNGFTEACSNLPKSKVIPPM